jgi:hypothetical protein
MSQRPDDYIEPETLAPTPLDDDDLREPWETPSSGWAPTRLVQRDQPAPEIDDDDLAPSPGDRPRRPLSEAPVRLRGEPLALNVGPL